MIFILKLCSQDITISLQIITRVWISGNILRYTIKLGTVKVTVEITLKGEISWVTIT